MFSVAVTVTWLLKAQMVKGMLFLYGLWTQTTIWMMTRVTPVTLMSHAVPWCLRKLFSPPSLHPSLDFAPLSWRQWRFVLLHATDFSFGRNQMYYTKRLSDSSLSYRFSALLCKEYAVIRFHRHGDLAPDYAILSTQEALLARIYKRAEQSYSFAFWLKNLHTYR